MNEERAQREGKTPLATIIGHAEIAIEPENFPQTPGLVINELLKKTGKTLEDIDLFEINEAFAAVALASSQIAELDPEKVNVNGGAVALGHPIGASGARIILTLAYELKRRGGGIGIAAICSGGGQGDAIMIEVAGKNEIIRGNERMEIKKVMVIGAGQMGGGIAQVCAQAGFDVKLNDIKEESYQKGLGVITKNLSRNVEKGRMTEDEKTAVLGRITKSLDLQDAADVDIIIEAAVENMDIKRSIFAQLDDIAPAHAILASNTSSLPITEIAAATKRPEKVIGMHFMNPVPVMKLVEIIRGLATADEVYQAVEDMTVKLAKTPVEVNDFPGFVSNRILCR